MKTFYIKRLPIKFQRNGNNSFDIFLIPSFNPHLRLKLNLKIKGFPNISIQMKVHIIPGNGTGDVQNCMWYPWVKNKLNNAGM